MQGHQTKTKLIIIYSSYSAIDPYTIRALSLEHKQCYNNIVIGKNKYMYILQQAGRPGSSGVSRNPLTRWDVSSIPANEMGFFSLKN